MEPPTAGEGKCRRADDAASGLHLGLRLLQSLAVEDHQHGTIRRRRGFVGKIESAIKSGVVDRDVFRTVVHKRPSKGLAEECFGAGEIARGEFDVVEFFVLIHGVNFSDALVCVCE